MMSGPPLECSEISSRKVDSGPSDDLSMEEAGCFGGRLSLDQSQQTPEFSLFFPGFSPARPRTGVRALLLVDHPERGLD